MISRNQWNAPRSPFPDASFRSPVSRAGKQRRPRRERPQCERRAPSAKGIVGEWRGATNLASAWMSSQTGARNGQDRIALVRNRLQIWPAQDSTRASMVVVARATADHGDRPIPRYLSMRQEARGGKVGRMPQCPTKMSTTKVRF